MIELETPNVFEPGKVPLSKIVYVPEHDHSVQDERPVLILDVPPNTRIETETHRFQLHPDTPSPMLSPRAALYLRPEEPGEVKGLEVTVERAGDGWRYIAVVCTMENAEGFSKVPHHIGYYREQIYDPLADTATEVFGSKGGQDNA